jgi:hypothetical protein
MKLVLSTAIFVIVCQKLDEKLSHRVDSRDGDWLAKVRLVFPIDQLEYTDTLVSNLPVAHNSMSFVGPSFQLSIRTPAQARTLVATRIFQFRALLRKIVIFHSPSITWSTRGKRLPKISL